MLLVCAVCARCCGQAAVQCEISSYCCALPPSPAAATGRKRSRALCRRRRRRCCRRPLRLRRRCCRARRRGRRGAASWRRSTAAKGRSECVRQRAACGQWWAGGRARWRRAAPQCGGAMAASRPPAAVPGCAPAQDGIVSQRPSAERAPLLARRRAGAASLTSDRLGRE